MNPATTPRALESRASYGRDPSRPSLPHGGSREEGGGANRKIALGAEGSEYGNSEKGACMSQEGSPKSDSKKGRTSLEGLKSFFHYNHLPENP